MELTRDRAWETLTKYTKSESLLRHALAVEASTRSYARRFDGDEELWAVVALLHDFDYEMHPTLDKHPQDGAPILREEGYPEDVIDAILSHAEHLDLVRDTPLKRTLFACDELSGFVHACGLVRPTGLDGLEPKSVKKKLKQPSFAAGVHRDEVYAGAELIGVELDEHIANVVAALQPISKELGLRTAADVARRLVTVCYKAAARRARSSSFVHQPHETRTRPLPGISRTAMSASARRATSAGGSSAPEGDERRISRHELDLGLQQLPAAARLFPGPFERPVGRQLERGQKAGEAGRRNPAGIEAGRAGCGLEAARRLVGGLGEVARPGDAQPLRVGHDERTGRIRPAQPLLAGDRQEVEAVRVDRDRPHRLGAVDEDRDARALAQLVNR